MQQYIEIDGKWIYIHGIVSVDYDPNVEEDGDVVDHEPVSTPIDTSTLIIKLANGDEITKSGGDASRLFQIIQSVSSPVLNRVS